MENIKKFIKDHQGGITTIIGILGVAVTITLQTAGNPDIEQAEGIQAIVEFFKSLDIYGIIALITSIILGIKEKYPIGFLNDKSEE